MHLQACLNGARTKAEHPAVPISIDELERDASACRAAGALSIHLHPRDPSGSESLEPGLINEVAERVRGACGLPISVSTGEWIEPELSRRLSFVRRWTAPDAATVNLGEEGALDVMAALSDARVAIEAGIASVADVERLASSDLRDRVARLLIEPYDTGPVDVVSVVEAIHDAIDRMGLEGPRLQHSDGGSTWVAIDDAVRRGVDTRVGLEDTMYEPDGTITSGNEALIRIARRSMTGT